MADLIKFTDLILSVLDQSPLRKGGTGADALSESVELAKICENLGYERYWVAEHHNSKSWTGTSPEILIGQIAANTKSIRVGSGGIMLPHYSALKVAEQFRVLDAFYPNRIDLGIGRAPGSDQITASALSYPKTPLDIRQFPQQVMDLLGFISGEVGQGHPFSGIKPIAGPHPNSTLDVWLLGSSDFSGRLAAILGIPFVFADFFGDRNYGVTVADLYRNEFKPSIYSTNSNLSVSVQVLCADTEQKAKNIASSRNLNKLISSIKLKANDSSIGKFIDTEGLLPTEEALNYEMSETERHRMETLTRSYIDGDPLQVRNQLVEVANKYGTIDIGLVTNCYSFKDRIRSYELIAETFNLKKN